MHVVVWAFEFALAFPAASHSEVYTFMYQIVCMNLYVLCVGIYNVH